MIFSRPCSGQLCAALLLPALGFVSQSASFGATSFVGTAGAAVNLGANWDNGLPTLANPGLLAGSDSAQYANENDLNTRALDVSGTSNLVGTARTRITNGDITIRDSAHWESDDDVTIGRNAGGGGTSVVRVQDNASFEVVDGDLVVGRNQKGDFIQSGGTVDVSRKLLIGEAADATGSSYQLNGGTLTVADEVNVENGTNFVIGGGTANLADKVTVKDSGSSYTQSGGVVNAAGEFKLDKNTAGTITGGELNVTNRLTLLDNATFNVSGGLVTATGDTEIDKATVLQTGGLVRLDGNLDITGDGVYNLDGGELQVAGTISVSSANGFLWGTGGTLGVHPSASTIQFDSDLNLSPGSVVDLDSPAEQLLILNDLTINGVIVDGYDVGLPAYSGVVQSGQLLLIEAALINGTEADITFTNFTGLNGMTRINAGDSFDPNTDSVYWFSVTGTQVTLDWSMAQFAAVPEPSTAFLLISGALLLGRRRR
jgi:hypothetical protein